MRDGTWIDWRRMTRTALTAAACGALSLGLGACGDDAAPEADDPVEMDDPEIEDDGRDEKPVLIRHPESVDPENMPPIRVRPPDNVKIETAKEPLMPDSGAKPALPSGPVDLSTVLDEMQGHYDVASKPIPRFDPAGRAIDDRSRLQDLKKHRERTDARNEALRRLVNLGSRYLETVGEDGAEPLQRYFYGYALSQLADRSPGDRAQAMRLDAVDQFKHYLGGPEEGATYLPDSEYLLGMTLLKIGDAYGPTTDEAVDHLQKGAALLLTKGRNEEAGAATYNILATLIGQDREKRALEIGAALRADEVDFGPRTKTVRKLMRRAALHPGAVMPEFDGLTDADGNTLTLAARRGAPVLIHLFQAGRPTGHPSAERDVETVLVPLAREYGPQGLTLIGGSLDLKLEKDQIEKIRANWEEWGTKGEVHDGSLESVRAWCHGIGMDWTLHHDGKWFASALAEHLGVNAPYAFLLDAEGVIRWRGRAPYEGLEEAVKKALVR